MKFGNYTHSIVFVLILSGISICFSHERENVTSNNHANGICQTFPDFTEGGTSELELDVPFMAEWWYLNGSVTLQADNGERTDCAFFVTMGHQESSLFIANTIQFSQLLRFSGLYFADGKTAFTFQDTLVSRSSLTYHLSLNTPYVHFSYPTGASLFSGTATQGYIVYDSTAHASMTILFKPHAVKTVDRSTEPLQFTTYEYSHGSIQGLIQIKGKKYRIVKGVGYLDHMIPANHIPWPMTMHGWLWAETTTDDYQIIVYAIRSLDDGYDNYSYKHVTIIDIHTRRIIREFSAQEIQIVEDQWIVEDTLKRKRPSKITIIADDFTIAFKAQSTINFDRRVLSTNSGFVDFMAYQGKNSIVKHKSRCMKGNTFFEYLVSDVAVMP